MGCTASYLQLENDSAVSSKGGCRTPPASNWLRPEQALKHMGERSVFFTSGNPIPSISSHRLPAFQRAPDSGSKSESADGHGRVPTEYAACQTAAKRKARGSIPASQRLSSHPPPPRAVQHQTMKTPHPRRLLGARNFTSEAGNHAHQVSAMLRAALATAKTVNGKSRVKLPGVPGWF